MTARKAVLALAVLALAGCDHLRDAKVAPAPAPAAEAPPVAPPPPTASAAVPVQPQRSCVPRGVGPAPRYPDSAAALRNAAGAADRYQLMAAGRLMRQRRLAELERVLAGCR